MLGAQLSDPYDKYSEGEGITTASVPCLDHPAGPSGNSLPDASLSDESPGCYDVLP